MLTAMRGASIVGLVGAACATAVATSYSPISWVVGSLSIWLAVGTARGWNRLDVWDQRLMCWGLLSILGFTHFLLSDPTFLDWSSVYYFCGPSMEFCTATYRWNLRGWRKAAALWNFTLSTALALQRLIVEAGLGGLLPGEEAVTRESFVSIAWRLVPFWLNRWESNFGAECSSIIFEIPHFALELLVVLPLVQILCGRLRIVGHPHLRLARRQGGAAAAAPVGEDDAHALAPNVLLCAWDSDSAQRRLLPRLRANLRIIAMIALVTSITAFNALVVPLALERQAAFAPRSSEILSLEPELGFMAEASLRALPKEASDRYVYVRTIKAKGGKANAAAAEGEAGGQHVRPLPTWAEGKSNSSQLQLRLVQAVQAQAAGGGEPLSGLLVSRHAVDQLLQMDGRWGSVKSLETAARSVYLTIGGSRGKRSSRAPDLDTLEALLVRHPSWAQHEAAGAWMCPAQQAQQALPGAAGPPMCRPEDRYSQDRTFLAAVAALRRMQRTYGDKVQRAIAREPADSPRPVSQPGQPISFSRLYRNMHKHASELRRMRDPDHVSVVPVVEAALAIMRLSCERWFTLVAVYIGYIVFRDPPPAAQTVIRRVAWVARAFRRAVLLTFPAVCWTHGAGVVFSTFASVIFWAGPLAKMVEQVRTTATSVQPRLWHPATAPEVERMGGMCAICWGAIAAPAVSQGGAGEAGSGDVPPGQPAAAAAAADVQAAGAGAGTGLEGGGAFSSQVMGLPCSHAYHRSCLLQWLSSCHGQGRSPTCPMCQAVVSLQVRYRLPIAAGQDRAAGAAGQEGDAEGEEGAGLHRRERGIPGLDALVEDLRDDFRHRFEQPLGDPLGEWQQEADWPEDGPAAAAAAAAEQEPAPGGEGALGGAPAPMYIQADGRLREAEDAGVFQPFAAGGPGEGDPQRYAAADAIAHVAAAAQAPGDGGPLLDAPVPPPQQGNLLQQLFRRRP